jgi:dTDP-glucose 4,6-dehydratase
LKLLITGGAGFIGSNFVRYMLETHPDYQIINLDKLTYAGNLDNLKGLEDNINYSFIKGDICDKELVDGLVSDVDAIVNFAAESHVDRSITNPEEFVVTNVLGVANLLGACLKNKVPRMLHISTDEVYGSIEEGSFRETDRLNPSSPYSSSKASADLLAMSYFTTFKLPVLITRSSNNYGPYQYPEKLIPLFVTNAMEDKSLPLYGSGQNVRDWLYVLDNCAGLDIALHKGKEGEIYNIGGGNEISNVEITNKIIKNLDKDRSLIKHVDDRLGHDFRYSISIDKIKELGWSPKHNFDDALKETIDWYKENTWWWQKLKSYSNA